MRRNQGAAQAAAVCTMGARYPSQTRRAETHDASANEDKVTGDDARAWHDAAAIGAGATTTTAPRSVTEYTWPTSARKDRVAVVATGVPGTTPCESIVALPAQNLVKLKRPKTAVERRVEGWDGVHTGACEEMYAKHVNARVQRALANGEHITVLMHGPPSTGTTDAAAAVASCVANDIFEHIQQALDDGRVARASVHVAGLLSAVLAPAKAPVTGRSISREVLLDLLGDDANAVSRIASGNATAGLAVREHRREGFYAEHASAVPVSDTQELRHVLDTFWTRRKEAASTCAGATAAAAAAAAAAAKPPSNGNAGKALAPIRSHAALIISVRLCLSDGAESWAEVAIADPTLPESNGGKQQPRKAAEDPVLKALWRVFDNLSAPGSQRHVAWRDSKWTRILKAGLGGGGALVLVPRVHLSDASFEPSAAVLDTCVKLAGGLVAVNVQSRVMHYGNAAEEHLQAALRLGAELGMSESDVLAIRAEEMELGMSDDARRVDLRDHIAERTRLLDESTRFFQ